MKAAHLKPKSMDEWAYASLILEAIDRGLRKEVENNLDIFFSGRIMLREFEIEQEKITDAFKNQNT